MKKIGLVLSATPAYSETFFNSKIKGLQEAGFKVTLFVQHKKKNFNACTVCIAPKVYKNVVIQTLAMCFVFLKLVVHFKSLKRFIQLEKQQKTPIKSIIKKTYLNAHILKQKVDWLHFGFATQALGSELVAKAIQAKMAVSLRGFDIAIYPIKHPKCYNLLWERVDKVHVISKDLLHLALKNGLKIKTAYKIITPAISIKLFTSKVLFNTNLTSKIKFLTVARLHWKKGIVETLEALSLLKEENINFQYTIIGDGIAVEEIKFAIYQLQLEKHVKILGKLEHLDVVHHMQDANIYIQYSNSEGFCNAVLEAQAMRLLCVVSDAEGLAENILDKCTGWVVPKRNPKLLAQKIIEVINLPDEEKQQIKQQARKRVEKHFTIEQQQKAFVDFYKDK